MKLLYKLLYKLNLRSTPYSYKTLYNSAESAIDSLQGSLDIMINDNAMLRDSLEALKLENEGLKVLTTAKKPARKTSTRKTTKKTK